MSLLVAINIPFRLKKTYIYMYIYIWAPLLCPFKDKPSWYMVDILWREYIYMDLISFKYPILLEFHWIFVVSLSYHSLSLDPNSMFSSRQNWCIPLGRACRNHPHSRVILTILAGIFHWKIKVPIVFPNCATEHWKQNGGCGKHPNSCMQLQE